MGDDLRARATVDVDGELVAHGAGRQEDRGLLVQQLRRHLAEAVHTGIVAALLVADRSLGHGEAHGFRRLRLGVAVGIGDILRRSEERRVGDESVRTCTYRLSPYHLKKKKYTVREYT